MAEQCRWYVIHTYSGYEAMVKDSLEKLIEKLDGTRAVSAQAEFARDEVIPKMNEIRRSADELEMLVAKKYWPFPTYGDMLFV